MLNQASKIDTCQLQKFVCHMTPNISVLNKALKKDSRQVMKLEKCLSGCNIFLQLI